jgi:hypothetical protein
MDSSNPFRIDSNARNWGGQPSSQGDKQKRRKLKLDFLLQCLKAGELANARQAYVALLNVDHSIVDDPYLSKIYTALQNSDLHSAQRLGLLVETNNHLPNTQPSASKDKTSTQAKTPNTFSTSGIKIDLSA